MTTLNDVITGLNTAVANGDKEGADILAKEYLRLTGGNQPEEQAENTEVKNDIPDATVGQIAAGLAAETAIATAGNVAGATFSLATGGLSYPILSFGAGVLGSLTAQGLEGRDWTNYSWGRAWTAGGVNLLPLSKATKLAADGAKITKQLVKQAAKEEAQRGAAIGAAESIATSVIDDGELPTLNKFLTYTSIGAGFGSVVGVASPKIAQTLSRKKPTSDVLNEETVVKETEELIDAAVDTSVPENIEVVTQVLGGGDPELEKVVGRKLSNQVDDKVNAEAVELIVEESPFKKIGMISKVLNRTIGKVMPNHVTGRGVSDIAFNAEKEVRAFEVQARKIQQTFRKAIDKDKEIETDLNTFLETGEVSPRIKANTDVWADIQFFQQEEYKLQNRLIEAVKDGYVHFKTPEAKEKYINKIIASQSEVYSTTNYELFTNPDFKRDPKLRQAAIVEIAKGLKSEKVSNEEAIQKATSHLEDLESRSAATMAGSNTDDKIESVAGIVKQKMRVGEAEAKYLGRVQDPAKRIGNTLAALGEQSVNFDANKNIVESLLNAGLATKNSSAAPDLVPLRLKYQTAQETKVFVEKDVQMAVANMYTDKGIREVNNGHMRSAWNLYSALNKAVKGANVLANISAYPINFYGTLSSAVSSGMLFPTRGGKDWFKSAGFALSEFKTMEDVLRRGTVEQKKQFRDEVLEMQKYGLGDGNVIIEDIKNQGSEGFLSRQIDKATVPLGKAYTVPDTAMRYSLWKHHQKSISRMYPDLGEEQLKKIAASYTNDTFNQYAKIPFAAKFASKMGLANPYVAHSIELARNKYNQARFSMQMMRGTFGKEFGLDPSTANQKLMRGIGIKNASALMATTYGASLAVEHINEEVEKLTPRMQKALRNYIPSYNKNSMVAFSMDEGSTIKGSYLDTEYLAQDLGIQKIINAAFRDDDAGFRKALNSLADMYGGEGSIVLKPFIEVVFNKELDFEGRGKRISNEIDADKAFVEKSKYLLSELFETGVQRDLKRLEKYNRGAGNLTKAQLLKRGAGFREQPFDLNKTAKFTIREPYRKGQSAVSSYYSALERGEKSEREISQMYQDANRIYNDALDEVRVLTEDLLVLGYDENKIGTTLKEAGISGADIFNIIHKTKAVVPVTKKLTTSEIYENAMLENNNNFSNALRSIPDMFTRKKLALHHKEVLGNNIKGLSVVDTVFANLGAGEQARILNRNPENIRGYVGKGIVKDETMFLLNTN